MRIIRTRNEFGHNKACVPCALAALTGRSYEDVNAWLLFRGYRSGNNRSTNDYLISKSEFGLKQVQGFRGMTVNQFLATSPVGEYYILVSGHALTVKGAIAYDTIDSTKRKIKEVWIKESVRLPFDFEKASQDFKAMKYYKEKIENNRQKEKEREKKMIIKRKEDSVKRKQIQKTDDFKVQVLQKRLAKWQKKQKACANALFKLNKKLKYYERKKQKATLSVA